MSAQDVTNTIATGGKQLWKFRMAILYCVLFSINSLLTTLIASLVNADWSVMNGQSRLLLYFVVGANWTGTMLAFMSKNSKKLEDGDLPDDTSVTITTTGTPVKPINR
jgi:hypothetical protein